MPRSGTTPPPEPRRGAEREAPQPIAGQDRDDEERDELEEPDGVPSLLTARELQAREPAASRPEEKPAVERRRTPRS